MTPQEAHEQYDKAELAACDEVRKYWMDKFEKAGIKFTADSWYGTFKATFNGYDLGGVVHPSRFNGAKMQIICSPGGYQHSYWVKVKSEIGFARLVDRLIYKRFI